MDFWARHSKNCRCGCNFNSFLQLEPDTKKAVNIVGGFLGAGKTTTLNHILSQPIDRKVDVIVKEFGAIAIDDKLLNIEKDRIHTFTGASLHLDQQTMLTGFIENLYANSTSKPFDNLLIETSGMESAEQIVQIFYLPQSRDHYELGSFITIVDAEYGRLNLEEFRVANEQTALADHLVINKCDRVDDCELQALIKELRIINPFASIIKTSFGEVDAEEVLYVDSYDQLKRMDFEKESEERMDDQFKSVAVRIKEPLDRKKVDKWIQDTYDKWGDKLLRGKGYFNIAGSDYRFDFQSVRKNFHAKTEYVWEAEDEQETVVVFIGVQIPTKDELLAGLSACIA